jgi:hypothetical protein
MAPLARFLILFAVAALLAACTVTRFAYLGAAPLLTWKLGDYVDLTFEQKEWVAGRLSRAMAWHRENELPEYRRFLTAVIENDDGRITEEEARTIHATLRKYYDRSIERLLPDMAEFVVKLDAAQLEDVERRFVKANAKLLDDAGTPEERRHRLARRYLEQFESWTGTLSSAQKEIIVNGLRSMPDLVDDRLADRRFRQTEFLALLRLQPAPEALQAGLRRILIDTHAWRRPEYARKLRERDERLFEMVAAVSAALTPEQRGNVRSRLRSYLEDVTYLIASN